MYPILFSFGPVTLYTYGLLIATAFLSSTLLAVRLAKDDGISSQFIYDLVFWIIIGSIVGARLLFVIVEYKMYLKYPLDIFMIWKGGLVYYGGLLGGFLAGLIYVKKRNIDVGNMADIAAPCIALGQGIGRIGCVMAGCCYGSETDVSWAIEFHDEHSLAPLGVLLHPSQIYSSVMNFSILGILLFLRGRAMFKGQIFLSYLILYSVGRFTVEFFRSDERGAVFNGLLSTSQFIAIITFIIGSVLFYFFHKRASARFNKL
ncbi:MAG: prolipoprotein diacylglyceryl transferase [Nitrospinae bacterium]|nr:prolipoprotein diacylglyceryl transferase [Nitrospinota bacterium]